MNVVDKQRDACMCSNQSTQQFFFVPNFNPFKFGVFSSGNCFTLIPRANKNSLVLLYPSLVRVACKQFSEPIALFVSDTGYRITSHIRIFNNLTKFRVVGIID